MLRMLASEEDLRPRVVTTGEVLVVVLVDTGDVGASILLLRRTLPVPDRNSLWTEWQLSSSIDAGDAERGESRTDMEAVRLVEGREMAVAPDFG